MALYIHSLVPRLEEDLGTRLILNAHRGESMVSAAMLDE